MGVKFNFFTSNFDFTGGGDNSSLWMPVVQSELDLPTSDPDGAVRAVLDTDSIYVFDSTDQTWTDTRVTVSAFSETASSEGISVSLVADGGVLRPTVTLHPADETNPGGLSISAQDISGNKTFKNDIIVEGQTKTDTIDSINASGTIGIGIANADIINIGRSGATVNIIGTTNTINVTNLDVSDKNITVNDGGAAGSGADAGIEVEEAGSISGHVKVSADRNSWRLKAPNASGEMFLAPNNQGFSQVINSSSLTSNRTLTIPDITGNVVVSEGNQTINGNKTISGTTNLSGLTASKPLKLDASKNIISDAISLTSDITGVNPIANGGTNSSAALTNNKAMISAGGAIVESSITTTELGHLSGVSSNIQTQLNTLATEDLTLLKRNGDRTLTGNLLPDVTETIELGSILKAYAAVYTNMVDSGAASKLYLFGRDGVNIDPNGRDVVMNILPGKGLYVNGAAIMQVGPPISGTDAANKDFVLQPNTGDIKITSFSGTQGVGSPTTVTGFAFANASIRSFKAIVTVVVTATTSLYQQFTINGIQRGSDWMITSDAVGDNAGVVFSITNSGQIQYTSTTYPGYSALKITFKAEAMPI